MSMNKTKIGLCTDSIAQLPPDLVERYGVEVVPLTVCVDDHEYLEGIDLDADQFYAMFTGRHRPTVSTSDPSPGQFALAYEQLAARGCTEILSIHVSSAISSTMNAARLGARGFEVPVRLVDSGTAGFGISCCVWAAGDAIAKGASLDQAAAIAESLAPSIGNVFIVGALDLVGVSGHPISSGIDCDAPGIPVLALRDGQVQAIDRVGSTSEAVEAMATAATQWGDRVNVAVGVADLEACEVADALQCAIRNHPSVVEVVRYRIGPSIGVHTGPGTIGCFMFPASLALSTRAAS
jgi:DegV family protein with EDD domain